MAATHAVAAAPRAGRQTVLRRLAGVVAGVAVVILLPAPRVAGQVPAVPIDTRVLQVRSVEVPPELDGELDEDAWRDAPAAGDFWLIDRPRLPEEQTYVQALTDGAALYLGLRAEDRRAGRLRDRGRERSLNVLDDRVSFHFDPLENGGVPLVLSVMPDGRRADNLHVTRVGTADWDAATHIAGREWTAELRVPYSVLGIGRGADTLRLNIVRFLERTAEWSQWAERFGENAKLDPGYLVLPASGFETNMIAPPASILSTDLAAPDAAVAPAPAATIPQATDAGGWSVPPLPSSGRTAPSGGTATVPPPQPLQAEPPVGPAPASRGARAAYRLQLGDVLEVRHFNNPELNALVPIRPDGRISLELIGDVQAAGVPVPDLQQELTERYRPLLRQPEVTVMVREFGGNKIYVGGEVNTPGVIRTNGHLTVAQALMEAGGFKTSAELRNVVILRNQGTPQPLFLTVNVRDALEKGQGLNDALLQPYDILFVPKTRISRMNDFVDQYIDEIIPLPITLGISYLFR